MVPSSQPDIDALDISGNKSTVVAKPGSSAVQEINKRFAADAARMEEVDCSETDDEGENYEEYQSQTATQFAKVVVLSLSKLKILKLLILLQNMSMSSPLALRRLL